MDPHICCCAIFLHDSFQAIVSLKRIQAFLQLEELTEKNIDRDHFVEGEKHAYGRTSNYTVYIFISLNFINNITSKDAH